MVVWLLVLRSPCHPLQGSGAWGGRGAKEEEEVVIGAVEEEEMGRGVMEEEVGVGGLEKRFRTLPHTREAATAVPP